MRHFKAQGFGSVYKIALDEVLNSPTYETEPRGMKIREITNAFLEFDPSYPMYENERRSSQFKYIGAELLWYFTGRKDTEFITKFAKFWDQIKNKDGTVNSAYGNLLFKEFNLHGKTEWEWAFDKLTEDKDTRQAVVHFNKPNHKWDGNKDFVCTLSGTFQIRENKLNFKVHMRSNDMVLGTATDVAFFCLLQQQMLSLLKPTYPDLELGSYIHEVDSLHIYERHFDLVEGMLKSDFVDVAFPEFSIDLINHRGIAHHRLSEMVEEIMTKKVMKVQKDGILEWIRTQINT
jgi:thymidylate synthase